MDKPTEHQPLDDFFKRKLKSASVTPSPDAWNRLQHKLTQGTTLEPQRRIGAAWYWSAGAAAACLVVAFFWMNDRATSTSSAQRLDIAQTKAIEVKPSKVDEKLIQPAGPTNADDPNGLAEAKSWKNITPEKQLQRSQRAINENEAQIKGLPVGRMNQTQESALVAGNPVKGAQGQESSSNVTLKPTATIEPGPDKLKETTFPTAPNERTLIVRVAEPDLVRETMHPVEAETEKAESQASGRETKVSRMLRQIKRLKDGDVMARADVADEEDGGLFNRIVRSARTKDNQDKSHKQ